MQNVRCRFLRTWQEEELTVLVTLPGGDAAKPMERKVRVSETVGAVRDRCCADEGIDARTHRVVLSCGRDLCDSDTFAESGVANGMRIAIVHESMQQRTRRILDELNRQYDARVRPVEAVTEFVQFLRLNDLRRAESNRRWSATNNVYLTDNLEHKKPLITILGPYSVGKSSLINYLLDVPSESSLRSGPEPATDKFTVLLPEDQLPLAGPALTMRQDLPFNGLQRFGENFQQRLEGLPLPCKLLDEFTIVDTPGMLEATGGLQSRPYEFAEVCRWFVECSDLVLVVFDPNHLDAGKELRDVFEVALRGHENKVRYVLNKADAVHPFDLMRVCTALYWSLGNMIHTTEPPRLYVGSFWNEPYKNDYLKEQLDKERAALLKEVREVLPQQSIDRRIIILKQRARAVLLHLSVHQHVARQVGRMWLPWRRLAAMQTAIAGVPNQFDAMRAKDEETDFPPADAYDLFLLPQEVGVEPRAVEELPKAKFKEYESGLRDLVKNILPQLLASNAELPNVGRKRRPEAAGQGVETPLKRHRN